MRFVEMILLGFHQLRHLRNETATISSIKRSISSSIISIEIQPSIDCYLMMKVNHSNSIKQEDFVSTKKILYQ